MAVNGFMIAAAGSGSGKTFITCGLLHLLSRRGMNVHSFKCGPDYIDPMFHSCILGIPCRNLDPYFTDGETLRYLYARNQEERDMAVVEGVMGYYDGIGGTSEAGSSYELAKILGIPVILVVSCKGMSLSAAAVIKGFLEFQEPSGIAGVILNQVSGRIYPGLKEAVEQSCGIPVIGYVPVKKEIAVESRHLGLVTPDQVEDLQQRIDSLADVLEETLDVGQLLEISQTAVRSSMAENPLDRVVRERGIDLPKLRSSRVRIAVARDEAFCFLYQDNVNLLEELGAELSYFSPLRDERIPAGVGGLILPGGYPELYARQLSENKTMLLSIKEAVTGGLPTLAECGGFLYLHESLEDDQNRTYPMTGVLKGKAYRTGRLGRFGYIELTARKDQLLFQAGEGIRAHEFHYWDSENCGADCHAKKASGLGQWDCVHGRENLYAGFPHIYFYGNINAAVRMVQRCMKYCMEHRQERGTV